MKTTTPSLEQHMQQVQKSLQDWQQIDAAHHLHPFTEHKSLHQKGTRIIDRAEGVYIYEQDGKKILDGMAGLWCVNIGYGRQELVEAAHQQMEKLPYYNNFFQCTNTPSVELAHLLAELTPAGCNRAFFTGSGSDSNDTIFRFVHYYWDLLGKPYKKVFIARYNAYHGSTVAAASLGGMNTMHAQGELPIPGIEHIDQPYYFDYHGELSEEEFGVMMARKLEEKIDTIGECNVAAFIAEPVQGAGGVIIPPASYWPEIKRICRERDILLVVDEVITGFGRMGTWFGTHYYDLEPDFMTLAKGLSSGYQPIGAVMVGNRVADTIIEAGEEFFHGYTYSGHPVAAAVALANLRILRDEHIIERCASEVAPYLQQLWSTLAKHPLVGSTRGVGMLGALELVKDKHNKTRFAESGEAGTICRDASIEHGLVMRAVRDTMIVSPPLVCTREHVDELIEKANKALDTTAERIRQIGLK